MSTSDTFSHGVVLRYGDDGSPEVFTAIGQLRDGNFPGREASVHDISDHSLRYRQKIGGMVDEGEVTFEVVYTGANDQYYTLRGLIGENRNHQLKLPSRIATNNLCSFDAVIKSVGELSADVDGAFTFEYSIAISGQATWSTE